MKRVIIAGSRSFENYAFLKTICDQLLIQPPYEIISGTARGVDQLGERYAQENRYLLKRFPADWDQYKKRAGFVRNQAMADYCSAGDLLIAFWDGQSSGTKMMIEIARKRSMVVEVIGI